MIRIRKQARHGIGPMRQVFSCRSRRTFLSTVALFAAVAVSSVGRARAVDGDSLAKRVEMVNGWRAEAESMVRKLKAKKDLGPRVSAETRDRYERVRAAFGTWRTALRADIAQDSVEASSYQKESLQRAAEEAAAFTGYAQGLLSRGGGHAIAALVPLIAADLLELLKVYLPLKAQRNKEARDEMNKVLDQLEWQPFESI